MAFFDKVKEAGVRGLDKAKDLGDQAKLGIQKEKAAVRMKDQYTAIGKKLAEEYPEILEQYFPEEAKVLKEAADEIALIEAEQAAKKA